MYVRIGKILKLQEVLLMQDFQLIKIKIQYFRSIYEIEWNGITQLNVITGSNDVGKSNILRALDLFFNDSIEGQTFDFDEEFSTHRAKEGEAKKEKNKGNTQLKRNRFDKYIKIECYFVAPKQGWTTTPTEANHIRVTKTFSPEVNKPQAIFEFGNLNNKRWTKLKLDHTPKSQNSTRFFNKFKFVYLPTCKDREVIQTMILNLIEQGIDKKEVDKLYLSNVFTKLPSIDQESSYELTAPSDLTYLIKNAVPKNKDKDSSDTFMTSLYKRGQGIQVKYMLELLKAVRKKESNKYYIVGFEEPEAYLEPKLTNELYNSLKKISNSQFLITTHSPIFYANAIDNHDRLAFCKRVQENENTLFIKGSTQLIAVDKKEDIERIDDLLGLQYAVGHKYKELLEIKRIAEQEKQELMTELESFKKPILFVEGDLDVRYIKKAAELLSKQGTLAKIEIRDGGGYGNLDHRFKFHKKDLKHIDNRILLLYDCDTNKQDDDEENKLYKRVIPRKKNNPIEKGIENLFSLETIKRIQKNNNSIIDYTHPTKKTEKGVDNSIPEKYEINESGKTKMCTWLEKNGTTEDFQFFGEVLFPIIENTLLANEQDAPCSNV